MRLPEQRTNIKGKSGDSLWRRWITRQILQNCGELSRQYMGRSTPKAENEAITFYDSQATSPKQIANYFNRQFTTSKLSKHTSSRNTRLVSREIKRKSLASAVTFTTDQVTKGISSCINTRAFRPDKLSILNPEVLNTSLHSSTTPSHLVEFRRFGSHPLSSKSQNQARTSHRPISLLCPVANVMEALLLPTINSHLLPSGDQHGFRPEHSTTSALL